MLEEVSNYLNQIRHDFAQQSLNEEDVLDSPIEQYAKWFEEAVGAEVLDPKAVVITTVNLDSKPSSRVVYVRGVSEEGFVIYTNYNSAKGEDLAVNPNVSLNIFWPELERQIRIEGTAKKVDASTSDAYFASRPRESQIGAWASAQSSTLKDRAELEQKVEELTKKFEGKKIERPLFWGGYLIQANYFEFWQGRPSRLHDRIAFELAQEKWIKKRLSP